MREMKEYPMTFREFIKQFPDETHCRNYLYKLRFPDGFVCPKCTNIENWKVKEHLYECTQCGRQTSVIAGTIFQDTRKPLMDWFIAIWWVTTQKSGASADGLKQVLGLNSDQTAWTWLHKIRHAMLNPNRTKLSGTVEVDETYIGGEKSGKRGRGAENKVIVAVACELDDEKLGRCRMSIIADASAKSLHAFITENIENGSQLISDDWSGFSGIEDKGYARQIHVQKYTEDEDKMLPHVHTIVSLLKRWLLGTHQGAVESKHLQAYLDEYVFRFNRRKSTKRGLLFYRLLESAMRTKTITYKDLTKHNM
jgi:transposase-like protein/Zn ribbon nucleic-acid-binding protein